MVVRTIIFLNFLIPFSYFFDLTFFNLMNGHFKNNNGVTKQVHGSHFVPLARQEGQYLNFDDQIQTQLGNSKPLINCMNFDDLDLLKNVISSSSSSSSSSSALPLSSSSSSSTLFDLNNGTFVDDEVWKENNGIENFIFHDGGVINLGNQPFMEIDPMVGNVMSQMEIIQQHHQHQHQQHLMTTRRLDSNYCGAIFENSVMDVVSYSENNRVSVETTKMEKTMERRNKRMIKNRESAARSRARKQAYTNKLEHEVLQLRKTNNRLKKQKEMKMVFANEAPLPRYQLRRTSSASF